MYWLKGAPFTFKKLLGKSDVSLKGLLELFGTETFSEEKIFQVNFTGLHLGKRLFLSLTVIPSDIFGIENLTKNFTSVPLRIQNTLRFLNFQRRADFGRSRLVLLFI